MDPLEQASQRYGNRVAVSGADASWTYADLHARATDLAERLSGLGLKPGEHLGIRLQPSAMGVALVHAAARAGLVLVPLDPRLPSAEATARARSAGLRLLISAEPLEGSDVTVVPVPRLLRTPRRAIGLFVQHANRAQAIVFTSGTGGKARGAVLSQGNIEATVAASARNLPLNASDRWLLGVPLFHVGGFAAVWRAAWGGAEVRVLPRFDAADFDRALCDGTTLASLVPVMLSRVLDAHGPEPFPPTLRAILLGGDAASAALRNRCHERRLPILPTYGLTEASSQVATASQGDAALPSGAVGKPLPGVGLAILDERGAALPRGSVGEVVVSGPTVARGYYNDPAATAARFRDGGVRTADLGFLDEHGYLWIVGRKDDRIVTGGENVDPLPIEEALRTHPAVEEACVVGLPDPVWGQVVAAAVQLRSPAEPGELEAHCRQRLAPFQVPRRFLALSELPRTFSGKVRRDEVVTRFGQETQPKP